MVPSRVQWCLRRKQPHPFLRARGARGCLRNIKKTRWKSLSESSLICRWGGTITLASLWEVPAHYLSKWEKQWNVPQQLQECLGKCRIWIQFCWLQGKLTIRPSSCTWMRTLICSLDLVSLTRPLISQHMTACSVVTHPSSFSNPSNRCSSVLMTSSTSSCVSSTSRFCHDQLWADGNPSFGPPLYSHIGGYKMCLKNISNRKSGWRNFGFRVCMMHGE